MNQSIEVIERDEDGHVVGTFTFWGRMTIDMNNGGGTISINAPGHHDPTPAEREREIFCKKHGHAGHSEGSPACEIEEGVCHAVLVEAPSEDKK